MRKEDPMSEYRLQHLRPGQIVQRLAIEISNTTDLQVYFRIAFPMAAIHAGSVGRADADETSLTLHLGEQVDLDLLPLLDNLQKP
jgi:hypothetical protein